MKAGLDLLNLGKSGLEVVSDLASIQLQTPQVRRWFRSTLKAAVAGRTSTERRSGFDVLSASAGPMLARAVQCSPMTNVTGSNRPK